MCDCVRCNRTIERLRAEVERLYSMIPGVVYMDPPDGGSVTRIEQMQRMAEDAARYRWLRHGDNDEECLRAGGDGNVWLLRNDALDDVIDAAMAAQEPRG